MGNTREWGTPKPRQNQFEEGLAFLTLRCAALPRLFFFFFLRLTEPARVCPLGKRKQSEPFHDDILPKPTLLEGFHVQFKALKCNVPNACNMYLKCTIMVMSCVIKWL